MAILGDFFRHNLTEFLQESPSGAPELHVLAVDDSLVDRKVIERLLKISSCKVTVVESGTRALQYLGLDGETSSLGFDQESSVFREIPVVIMSSENVLTRIDRSYGGTVIGYAMISLALTMLEVTDSLKIIMGIGCLEEGAEEFLLKPVKLSDVRRLKDFIMKGKVKEVEKRTLKRMRSIDCSPPLSATCSTISLPCDPSPSLLSPLSSKKARL
ncbi:hypothetical protein ACSQ67_007118 [Phaseolus vulgaris]